MIKFTKKLLKSRFDMKNMGLTYVILGIKTSEGIVLSQSHYVDKNIEKFNKDNFSFAKSQIDWSQHLSNNRGENISQLEYLE